MKIPVILLVLIIVGTLAEQDHYEAGDGRMLADFYELAEEDRTILNEKKTKKMQTKNGRFGRKYLY